jgi:hypothetical protein
MGLLGTIQVPPLKRLAIHAKVIATFYFFTLPSVRPLAPGQ